MVIPKSNLLKDGLFKLMSERDRLEAKISENGFVLAANDNIGLNCELVDAEGFPRSEIDLHQVRLARHQIICLQNDHKALTKKIEELLHQLHAEVIEEQQQGPAKATEVQQQSLQPKTIGKINLDSRDDQFSTPLVSFAEVKYVSPGSPAEIAGVQAGDKIMEFGSINPKNFTGNLNQFATVTSHMQNKIISLKIEREKHVLNIRLTPRKWSGHGLLGCNIDLFNAVECPNQH